MNYKQKGMENIRVIGICGSPRDGNTAWIMEKIFKNTSSEKIEAELILLRKLNIELCDGCLTCEDTGNCIKDDDMKGLYEKLSQCDRIVFGTPIYFNSIPSLLKKFIDRLNPLCINEKLKNKDMYAIVIGQLRGAEAEDSQKKVIDYFRELSGIFGMTLRSLWGFSAREAGAISKMENIEKYCKEISNEIYR